MSAVYQQKYSVKKTINVRIFKEELYRVRPAEEVAEKMCFKREFAIFTVLHNLVLICEFEILL